MFVRVSDNSGSTGNAYKISLSINSTAAGKIGCWIDSSWPSSSYVVSGTKIGLKVTKIEQYY